MPESCSRSPWRLSVYGASLSRPAPLRAHQRPLFLQMARHLFEDIFEHQIGVEPWTLGHRAEGRRLLPARRDQRLEFGRQRLMRRLRPLAQTAQVQFEPQNRIAEGPVFVIILGAI